MTDDVAYSTMLLVLMIKALKSYPDMMAVPGRVYAPGDWPTDPSQGPALQVGRIIRENKEAQIRGQPEFTTTAYVTVDGRLTATDGIAALSDINRLRHQVMQAIITNAPLNSLIQKFTTVQTHQEINSETGQHVAFCTIDFALEFFEAQEQFYMPVNPQPLNKIVVYGDLRNVFDPTRDYTGSDVQTEFPDSIMPAPRISGPDGRTEFYIEVDNLQNSS